MKKQPLKINDPNMDKFDETWKIPDIGYEIIYLDWQYQLYMGYAGRRS